VRGLSFTGRKAWELAGAAGRARCIVVTRMDEKELDWGPWVAALGEGLGARCVPVVAPQGGGKSFAGVERVPLGGAGGGPHAALADALVEAIVEVDDAALTRFLEQDQRPSEDEATALLRRSLVAGTLVPVLAVSSLDGKGVEELLDFIARCAPSPADGPVFKDEAGAPVEPTAAGTSAFVFKTIIDPYVGRLSLARVVTGELAAGASLVVARTGKPEKLAHLQLSQGKEHIDVPKACAGDIVAIPKLEAIETSDTLCDATHPRHYPPLKFPRPMVARSIEPVNHADDAKLSTALKRTAAEDPTFIHERDEATGQLVVRGMSIMHLETVLRRIKEPPEGRGQGRPAARRPARDGHAQGRRTPSAQEADRRARPVRRGLPHGRGRGARRGPGLRRTTRSGARCPSSSSRPSRRASASRCRRASWPATRWST
jgi:elongation factor G